MASPTLAAAANPSSPRTLDANPSRPAPRKRPLLLLEQRPASTPSPVPPGDAANHLAYASRGAAPLPPQPVAAARRKKPPSSAHRPRWQTVLSVAAKNAALLAVLLYLGDLAWRWGHPPPPPPQRGEGEFSAEYEARIAEVEASLGLAFRMLQVQLEAVDKKIAGEVGSAKGELSALLEEKRLALEDHLRRIDARTDELDEALRGLKWMEFLRKDEFEKFWNEVKGSLDSGGGSNVDLDQVRALAREITIREIEKHAADGLGRVDYAVASGGAEVVRHSQAYDAGKLGGLFSTILGGAHSNPRKMLEPSFGEPGQCFALQGSSGFVEIRLRTGIIPEAVTLEHVSKDVAYDRSTAPKDCQIAGWYETPEDTQSSCASKMSLLTEFTYDLEKNNVQTFDITASEVGIINRVRLDFTSNHGSSALTCIYRLRVHGHKPVSLQAARIFHVKFCLSLSCWSS